MNDQLPAIVTPTALGTPADTYIVPTLIAAAGEQAGWRYIEFFTANIRNPNTRRAYARACSRFFSWCEDRGLELITIRPVHVATWIEQLQEKHGAPGVKQQLAAVRMSSYGRDLLAANTRLTEPMVVRTLAGLLDFADGHSHPTLHDYRYPEPDEPHPIAPGAQRRKIATAQQESVHARMHALVHGYGPAEDFASRLRIAWQASNGRVWLNRYGYLADAKLDAIGTVQRG